MGIECFGKGRDESRELDTSSRSIIGMEQARRVSNVASQHRISPNASRLSPTSFMRRRLGTATSSAPNWRSCGRRFRSWKSRLFPWIYTFQAVYLLRIWFAAELPVFLAVLTECASTELLYFYLGKTQGYYGLLDTHRQDSFQQSRAFNRHLTPTWIRYTKNEKGYSFL